MYVPGKHLHEADALSRAYIEDDVDCGFIDTSEVMVHSETQNFPGSTERLEQIRNVTSDKGTISDYTRSW